MEASRISRTSRWGIALGGLTLLAGCETLDGWFTAEIRQPNETLILKSGALRGGPTTAAQLSPELAAGQEFYRDGLYGKAEKIFHRLAENTKNPPLVAEEARFYEAECLYRQDAYPKACDTYNKLLIDFPNSAFRDQAVRRMFDIANYWLEDTRTEMAEYREKKEGKRSIVLSPLVHFEKKKPLVDEEGRAMQALENVHLNDVTGPLADKALFLAGGVKFYREDYREADHFFTQIVDNHPNSPLAAQAVELAIISKHMSTGGSEYDGRKVAEARILVDTALRNYPELAREKSGFLERQLFSINYQQAEKDFNTAEFYRRTRHPGSAYYYYEIVRRRYPGSKFAEAATEHMADIRKEVEEGKFDPNETNAFQSILNSVEKLWDTKPKPLDTTARGDADRKTDAPSVLPPPRPVPTEMLPQPGGRGPGG